MTDSPSCPRIEIARIARTAGFGTLCILSVHASHSNCRSQICVSAMEIGIAPFVRGLPHMSTRPKRRVSSCRQHNFRRSVVGA